MPKKLKFGVSAAWRSDTSGPGWGAPPSAAPPADNWGGWGNDSWGNVSGGDIWDTVAAPAAADPPPDWGYDDGWDGPAPNIKAQDVFPSLIATKPKRSKNHQDAAPQKAKPADFSTVLGTKSWEDKGRNYIGESKGWIQQSIQRNRQLSDNNQTKNGPSYLQHATTQPTKTFEEIFHAQSGTTNSNSDYTVKDSPAQVTKNEGLSQTVKEKSENNSLYQTSKMRNKSVDIVETTNVNKSPANLTKDLCATKKPIYEQLREQLHKVSSLGKPLVYIIQNGSITVQVTAE